MSVCGLLLVPLPPTEALQRGPERAGQGQQHGRGDHQRPEDGPQLRQRGGGGRGVLTEAAAGVQAEQEGGGSLHLLRVGQWGTRPRPTGPRGGGARRRGAGRGDGGLCAWASGWLPLTLPVFCLSANKLSDKGHSLQENVLVRPPLGLSGLPVGCQGGEMSCRGGEPPEGQPGPLFPVPMSRAHMPPSFLAQSQGRGMRCSLGDGEHLATSGRWARQEWLG